MGFKSKSLFVLLLVVFSFQNSYSQTSSMSSLKSEGFRNKNYLSESINLDLEFSLEYQKDQIRNLQNQTNMNVRDLSVRGEFFNQKTSSLVIELLGEESTSGDLNLNIGELYYQAGLANLGLNFQVGIQKLAYGILNDIDGQFSVLPSYYNLLYDLPRGLDTGLGITKDWGKGFYSSVSVYAGKNLRSNDSKNRDPETPLHHLKLGWQPDEFRSLSLNYFSKKYETQPLVYGFSMDYSHTALLQWWDFNLDLQTELWTIETSLNDISSSGLAFLVAPKLSFKKAFLQPYVSLESWSQDQSRSEELFFTGKLGYHFNKNFTFMLEQSRIENLDSGLIKENSLQARVVSQWAF